MSETHRCRTLEPYLTLIQKRQKLIEGRTYSEKYQKFKPGDILHLYNEKNEAFCRLKALRTYPTFQEMLLTEGLNRVVPNAKTVEEGVEIYKSFPNFPEEAVFGVVALEIELLEAPLS